MLHSRRRHVIGRVKVATSRDPPSFGIHDCPHPLSAPDSVLKVVDYGACVTAATAERYMYSSGVCALDGSHVVVMEEDREDVVGGGVTASHSSPREEVRLSVTGSPVLDRV